MIIVMMTVCSRRSRRRAVGALLRVIACAGAVGTLVPDGAAAQTDYYNTDAGRPIRIEDAYPVERRAFEVQLAPLSLERGRGGRYHWGLEPELAYGVLPRTHIEIGVPVAYRDGGSGATTAGLAGIDVSLFHNLNTETAIPAFAIALGALLPAGHLGPERAHGSAKAIVTRTFRWARLHVNGEYTVGDEPSDSESEALPRWMTGVAIDRTVPLSSFLVTGELYAEQPAADGAELRWNTGVGVRYQLSPRFNVDAGLGRRFTGEDQSWRATFGTAFAFGLPWYP